MKVTHKGDAVFVTGLDGRERSEVMRVASPRATKEERRDGLKAFLERHGESIDEKEEVFVWL